MAALSATTGLSPQDINSWASNLPAGTTIKVTHHYDQSLAVSKAASTLMKQTSPSVSSPQGSIDHVFTRYLFYELHFTVCLANNLLGL